jgi:hypothetical protein
VTKVLHSPSNRLLKNIHGDSTNKAPIRLTIPGFETTLANHQRQMPHPS